MPRSLTMALAFLQCRDESDVRVFLPTQVSCFTTAIPAATIVIHHACVATIILHARQTGRGSVGHPSRIAAWMLLRPPGVTVLPNPARGLRPPRAHALITPLHALGAAMVRVDRHSSPLLDRCWRYPEASLICCVRAAEVGFTNVVSVALTVQLRCSPRVLVVSSPVQSLSFEPSNLFKRCILYC